MDAATLQNRIYKGYGKAAARLGILYDVFRPTGALNPIAPSSKQLAIPASFNAEDWTYTKPNKYGRPTWYGLFDGTATRAGDYLVSPDSVYFIAAQQLHLSILCVQTNRSVAVLRNPVAAVGAQPYGGIYPTNQMAVLGSLNGDGTLATGWPASILLLGRAEAATGLPMSMKDAGYQILLPSSVPIILREGELFLDDLGRRYVAESCEQTDLGWRINAKESHA